MFKYTIGNKQYKSVYCSDVTLFAMNPTCLRILSDEHYFAYNGFNPDYKEVNLFNVASQFINVKIEKIDGRRKEHKSLKKLN